MTENIENELIKANRAFYDQLKEYSCINNSSLPQGEALLDSDITGFAAEVLQQQVGNNQDLQVDVYDKLKAAEKMSLDQIIPEKLAKVNNNIRLKQFYDRQMDHEAAFLQREFAGEFRTRATELGWNPKKIPTLTKIAGQERSELVSQVNQMIIEQQTFRSSLKKATHKAQSLTKLKRKEPGAGTGLAETKSHLMSFVNDVRTDRLSTNDLTLLMKDPSQKLKEISIMEFEAQGSRSQRKHLLHTRTNSEAVLTSTGRYVEPTKSLFDDQTAAVSHRNKMERIVLPMIDIGVDLATARARNGKAELFESRLKHKPKTLNWYKAAASKKEPSLPEIPVVQPLATKITTMREVERV